MILNLLITFIVLLFALGDAETQQVESTMQAKTAEPINTQSIHQLSTIPGEAA